MNLDTPAFSRFVERLSNEFHNCWTNSCTNDGQVMLDAITRSRTEFADPGRPEPDDQ